MATTGGQISVLMALFFFLVDCADGSYCTTGIYSTTYCINDCCGTYPYQYCCSSYYDVGLIVGCVFAGISALCVIIALICCCVKKSGQAGRVVQPAGMPANRSNVTFISRGGYVHQPPPPHAMNPYQPMGGMPPQPPHYKPHDPPPPAYTYPDPAYPPGGNPNFPQNPQNPQNPPNPFAAYAAGNGQPPASTSGNASSPGGSDAQATK